MISEFRPFRQSDAFGRVDMKAFPTRQQVTPIESLAESRF
jgi:hypothetical protein